MSYMCISLLLFKTHSLFKPEYTFVDIEPVTSTRRVFGEEIACKYTVSGGILDVYVEIGALHGNDNVKVDLQVMRDTFFNSK